MTTDSMGNGKRARRTPCVAGSQTILIALLAKHIQMRACRMQVQFVTLFMINDNPIVGDARNMALALVHEPSGKRMILEELVGRNVGSQLSNHIGQWRKIPMPFEKPLEATLEIGSPNKRPHDAHSAKSSSTVSNLCLGKSPDDIASDSRNDPSNARPGISPSARVRSSSRFR